MIFEALCAHGSLTISLAYAATFCYFCPMPRVPSSADYDALPYDGQPDPLMHPNRAAAVAAFFGLHAAPPRRARVLDIGCATGTHLIPMAYQFPEASFVGFDYSPAQIKLARATADALGLRNVDLHVRDLARPADDLGTFDYIIAHGIYSWIPAGLRPRLLELCQRHLSPHGIALIDYNVLPGWHFKQILRDIMSLDAAGDLGAAATGSLELLDFVGENLLAPGTPYGQAVGQLQKWARPQAVHYLAHEFAAPVNDPVLFTAFAAEARAAGLEPAGDMQIGTALPPQVAARIAPRLAALSNGDVIRREQIMDFLRGREFRRTLLVHKGVWFAGEPQPEAAAELFFSTAARPEGVGTYRTPDGAALRTGDARIVRVMDALCRAAPGAVPFADLATRTGEQAAALGELLLRLAVGGIIQPMAEAPAIATAAGECPRASPIARLEAQRGRTVVTTLCHQAWAIDAFGRRLLPLLDGTRERTALLAAVGVAGASEEVLGNMLKWMAQIGLLEG